MPSPNTFDEIVFDEKQFNQETPLGVNSNRTIAVAAETRLVTVQEDSRTISVPT